MNWLKKLWRKLTKGKPREIVTKDKVGKILCAKEACFFFCNGRCRLRGECIPIAKIPVPAQIVLAADLVRHEQVPREMDRPEDRLKIMTAEEHIELHRRKG